MQFFVRIFRYSDNSVTFGFLGVIFYGKDGFAQVTDILFSGYCHDALFCISFVTFRHIAAPILYLSKTGFTRFQNH